MATIGLAFGMHVIAWSQNLTDERCAEVDPGVRRVSKEQLFAQSDFLSIHTVQSSRTIGLVGAEQIGSMKPSGTRALPPRQDCFSGDVLQIALSACDGCLLHFNCYGGPCSAVCARARLRQHF